MRRFYFFSIVLLLLPFWSISQLSESFTDGDFTNNPTWTGDVSKYEVTASQVLHTNGPAQSDTAYLSVNVGNLDFSSAITWEFFVQMNLNPSNSNNARVYLVSNSANLKGGLNGYFIRIGENGSADALKFYKQTGTTTTLLFTGTGNTFGTTPTARIQVIRNPNGDWVFSSDATGGTNFVAEGTVNNSDITASQFFGVWSKYTASNNLNFFYDDFNISGNVIIDSTPPEVNAVTVVSSTQLDVEFNEPVTSTTAQTLANYTVNNGIGTPSSAQLDGSNPNLVHLSFASSFTDGTTYTITIQNIADLAGNIMVTSSHNFLYFIPVPASYKDIVINEIFADPSPQLGLPQGEFIELYNASNKTFNLANWTIGDAGSDEAIGNHVLQPQQYVVIADDDYTNDFSIFPNVIFVPNLPSYNNSTDDVVLKDDNGTIIDKVTYTTDWYGSADKAAGGYSLELINPTIPCTSSENWIGSNDPIGGTPGLQNSVYDPTPDNNNPVIVSASTANNATINICFSETIDTTGITQGSFSISNGIPVTSFSFNDLLDCVELITGTGLDTGMVYTLSVSGIGDCSGNVLNGSTEVILPHDGKPKDIIINEILFNPYPNSNDFVELYNNSSKNIDLYNWQLANVAQDTIANNKVIDVHFLLKPGEYVVVTNDSLNVKETYSFNAQDGRFIELSALPSFPDNEGTVILILSNNQVGDSVYYNKSYHFALLKETEGVSLERIDFNRNSNDPTNWHSASEASGWATPTVQNSQYSSVDIPEVSFSISPEMFSPDNDGFDDVITFSYNMGSEGYVGNITIFDMQGRIIKNVMQNELLGVEGQISWDGLSNDLEKARIGTYIVYFEFFDLRGNVKIIKKPFVLAGKF